MTFEEELEIAKGAWRSGNIAEAVQLATRLSESFPVNAAAWGHLALFEFERGAPALAAQHALRATLLAPQSELASMLLFHSLWRLGDRGSAVREARRFLQEQNPSQSYRELISDLKSDGIDL